MYEVSVFFASYHLVAFQLIFRNCSDLDYLPITLLYYLLLTSKTNKQGGKGQQFARFRICTYYLLK